MKKRILVADDEPDITWMIKINLEQTGRYEVRTENQDLKAIEAALDPEPRRSFFTTRTARGCRYPQ
jgi:DNA-binding NtrC family response regulator